MAGSHIILGKVHATTSRVAPAKKSFLMGCRGCLWSYTKRAKLLRIGMLRCDIAKPAKNGKWGKSDCQQIKLHALTSVFMIKARMSV